MCSDWTQAIGTILLAFFALVLCLGVLPISIVYFTNKVLDKDKR